jgi:hypothetical protein
MNWRRLRPILPAVLAVTAIAMQVGSTTALFNRTVAVGANGLTAGTWGYYLHNNPTAPVANTAAQYNLTMTTTKPTATTLYNYDTDSANRPGRGITRANPPSAALITNNRYVNWRTPALASALTLTGTVTVDLWSATNTATANRTGSVIAYLRDYDPATATYVEIANGTYTGAYAVGRTYYERPITVTVSTAYVIAAGHELEAKIESPRATSQNNMLVAYDTTADSSVVRVR